jgi:hypothetical protein
MEQGLRYMNMVLVFLTVSLLLFTAYPMITGGGIMIAAGIIILSALVALSTFIYTREFKD